MLKIFLFGTPRIIKNGQPFLIRRKQVRTLLFYLGAQEKPASRLAIAELFWPDYPEDRSRFNLSDTVGKLRHDLGENKHIVINNNELLGLSKQGVWVDYLEYHKMMVDICEPGLQIPAAEKMNLAQYAIMSKMIALWGGQELFEGYDLSNSDALERWRSQLNLQVSDQILTMLERLAAFDSHRSKVENAIRWLEIAAGLDAYNEKRHAELLKAYLKDGKLSRARQYYEEIKDFWFTDLGEDLPEKLVVLEKYIYKPKQNPRTELPYGWPVETGTQIPFIGQENLLDMILHSWQSGESVLVLGEAGTGKTRLVQETYQRLKADLRLLIGNCDPLYSNQPFAPWVNLLRQGVPEDTWKKMDKIWLQALTLLLPELANLRDDITPFSEKPEISQVVLIEAIHKTLALLASQEPLFIFIDDLQWADEASLAVISHLISHRITSQEHVMLVMAARIEERNPLLDRLLATHSAGRIRQIQISTLETEVISEISRFMLGKPVSESFLKKLEQDTGGNPLLLIEILQNLLDGGLPDNLEEIETLPLPQSVHELLQTRLANISADAREVLNTAALLGSQFALDVIEHATLFQPETVLQAIDELEKGHLLQPIPGEPPSYRFPHEKIRESILVGIGNAKKRLLHQNIARTLEEAAGSMDDSQAANLAYHYEKAGDLPKAFRYWSQAGKHAHRLGAIHESVDAFERAERLIPRVPELKEQDLYSLYSAWNDALFQGDQPHLIKRVNTALLALGKERQSPLLIGAALSGMSDAYMAANDFEMALKAAEEGLQHITLSGNQYEKARILERIGVYLYMLNRMSDAQPYLQQSLAISKDSTDPLMIVERFNTYYQLAITTTLGGNPKQGLAYAEKILEDASLTRQLYGHVLAYSVMGLAHYLRSDYAEGCKTCQQGMSFEYMQSWRMLGYISSYYGMNAAEMGRIQEAWHFGQKAIALGREHGHGEVAGLGYKAIGDLYLRLGAHSQAAESYFQGMSAAGNHFVSLENMHRYGYLLYKQGKTALGKEMLQNALDISAQSNLWSIHFLGSIHEFEIMYEEKDEERFTERIPFLREKSMELLEHDITWRTCTRLNIDKAYQEKDFPTVLALAGQILPLYKQKNALWRELACLKKVIDAKTALGQDSLPEAERMQTLIQFVNDNLGDAPLGEIWQEYQQKLI